MTSSSSAKSIAKPLYRSLLRAVQPFVCKQNGPILCSLIHRSGLDDHIDYLSRIPSKDNELNVAVPPGSKEEEDLIQKTRLTKDQAMDLTRGYDELRRIQYNREKLQQSSIDLEEMDISAYDDSMTTEKWLLDENGNAENPPPADVSLYKELLREVMGPSRLMFFPSQIREQKEDGENFMERLLKVIRREFRNHNNDVSSSEEPVISSNFADLVRQQTAFLALREISKKLLWAQSLELNNNYSVTSTTDKEEQRHIRIRNHNQKARGVSPLPDNELTSYFMPGSYLVAHPLLGGYFSRTVIAILDHNDDSEKKSGGTYGLVVNRKSTTQDNDTDFSHNRTLCEVVRPNCLPSGLTVAFGNNSIREGGPVNLSLQMIYSATSEQEDKLDIGGTLIPTILTNEKNNTSVSAAIDSNNAIYYQGDIIKASQSVIDEEMDRDDFSFLIGASCWEVGQLESEIARGYWLHCCGPPQIAHTGTCEHVDQISHESDDNHKNDIGNNEPSGPKSDLWLSMMCAFGDDEANFSHSLLENNHDENGNPSDDV